jgi:hypothetical protein
MQAELPLASRIQAPVFLTHTQHTELERFINEAPSKRPQMLMPVGTIKSGKSTVLREVLPGLLAAAHATRWPAGRKRPVIFTYEFPLGRDALAAVVHLRNTLSEFGQSINVPFDQAPTPSAAFDTLPTALRKFATRVDAAGGELWLLLDEVQAPVLGSTPSLASDFTYTLKNVSTRDHAVPVL